MTEDEKTSQKETITISVQVDTVTKQLASLEDQLQLQDSQCAKLTEDLEKSYKEVSMIEHFSAVPLYVHRWNTCRIQCIWSAGKELN